MESHETPIVIPGQVNSLRLLDIQAPGAYLEGDELDPRILLPGKEIPKDAKPGDVLDVFLYFDSEDRIVATLQRPKVMLGEFAFLKVVGTTRFGAFVDWGLPKDLLVPRNEQEVRMIEGESYLVRVKKDRESDLLIGTNKEKYLFEGEPYTDYRDGDTVSLLPYRRSRLGISCLINNDDIGLLFRGEYPEDLPLGERIDGWIREIRPDGKINLTIRSHTLTKKTSLGAAIMQALRENDGFLPLHDRSTPEEIHARFQVSKKRYKSTIAKLYKNKKITIEPEGIRKV